MYCPGNLFNNGQVFYQLTEDLPSIVCACSHDTHVYIFFL